MKECSRITKLHVTSDLLAEKSSFFRDLFANATMESEQRCAALSIHAPEETAFLELLNYMYGCRLTATTAPALLGVLKLADKFQVVSCIRLCASLLIKMLMTTESATALLCMDLTSGLLLMAHDEVQHLVDDAKHFMAARFGQIPWHEIMKMPLVCMEAILSSDSHEICSEDMLFSIARSWIRDRYPKPEDQREIFSTRLGRYIRFPYMSTGMLMHQVLGSDVLDEDFARKVVVDALYFKITTPFHHYHDATRSMSTSTSHRPYVRRAYEWRLIKVVEFEFPCPEVVVYFDLCTPVSSRSTVEFNWGGQWFRFFVSANFDQDSRFAVYFERNDEWDEPLALEYEFAVRSKCTKKFVLKSSGSLEEFVGWSVVYETPWLDFEAGKSLDFIDGVLYVECKIRRIMQ